MRIVIDPYKRRALEAMSFEIRDVLIESRSCFIGHFNRPRGW
jgi:hypothetical protein